MTPSTPPQTGGIARPAGDPEKAILSEFEALAARGTIEAYELFIARHPDHELAKEAQKRIDALCGRDNP